MEAVQIVRLLVVGQCLGVIARLLAQARQGIPSPCIVLVDLQRFGQMDFGRFRVAEFFVQASQFDARFGILRIADRPVFQQTERPVGTSGLGQQDRQTAVAVRVGGIQIQTAIVQRFGLPQQIGVVARDARAVDGGGHVVKGVRVGRIARHGLLKGLHRGIVLTLLVQPDTLEILAVRGHLAAGCCDCQHSYQHGQNPGMGEFRAN